MATLCKFEHLGRTLEIAAVEEEWPVAAMPDVGGAAPEAPAVMLGPITLSTPQITPTATLQIAAPVGGADVAAIYLELLLRDPQSGQYYGPVYREPFAPPRTRTVGGVSVPDWREPLVAQVAIQPFLRLLTDGRDWAFGFVRPQAPGPAAVGDYTLEALYRSTWGRNQYRAEVTFAGSGEAQNVLVFRDVLGGAAPRSVNPRRGDRFAPLLRLYRQADTGEGVVEKAVVQGNTLKWRDNLRWKAEPLLPGVYLIGFVAQDLDGQPHRRYTELLVRAS